MVYNASDLFIQAGRINMTPRLVDLCVLTK